VAYPGLVTEGEATGLRLDQQLCFAAYAASRALTGRYRAGLDELGLTYSQYLVMMVLWEHGPVTMGFLGRELHLDSGTLSPLLRRLEALGRLTRHRRPADERTVEVAPTAEGMALEERAARVQARVARDTGLTPDGLARLRDELHELTRTLSGLESSQLIGADECGIGARTPEVDDHTTPERGDRTG
jgi:MarR family transcriptional regulator, organic hydroperoxide resistance regulator